MPKTDFETIARTFVLKNLPESEVELTGEIPVDAVAPYREMSLKHIAERLDLPGFRPGKVPPEMALKRVGETAVLEEAAEHFMQEFYPALIAWHNVDAVGRPNIRITKLAPENPIGITIQATVYPEVALPKEYKRIGERIAAETPLPATDEEVEKTIQSLRESRKNSGELPELNDDFAKSLGAFENVDALKAQIKKGITDEKERGSRDSRRGKIVDALLEKTKVEVPKIFIESELEKIMSQMKDDVARFNIPFEEYLKRVGKTEEMVRNEFRDQAKKRAKLQLTLNKIANEEKIEAEKEAVETEMKHALEHFPDARKDLLRIHIETVLRNEKVLKMLEGETADAAP